MHFRSAISLLLSALAVLTSAQFPLPETPQEVPKTVVSQEYSKYFGLNPGNEFLSLFRGLIPPPNYEVAGQASNSLNAGGIPLNNAFKGLQISRVRNRPVKSNSSIAGIPNTIPNLPKASGVLAAAGIPGGRAPIAPNLNSIGSRGFGGTPDDIQALIRGSQSPILNPAPLAGIANGFPQGINAARGFPQGINSLTAGSGPVPQAGPQNDNLVGQLLKAVGLNDLTPNLDLNALNTILGLAPSDGNVLSQVLYSALTDKPAQTEGGTQNSNRANAAIVQQLLTQPSSPFCTPKPKPVQQFNLASFEGRYYQVLYSPPMSLGPCSMIAFSKLADIGNGGPGTMLNIYEYTNERTPTGRPIISSGYATYRAPGEFIFRTSNNPTDLNVYVLKTGPLDKMGYYEYVVLSVNCNYPIYVYARDPVKYEQKFKGEVNSFLETGGLAISWAFLTNVVRPVDSSACTFPPGLFNTQVGF